MKKQINITRLGSTGWVDYTNDVSLKNDEELIAYVNDNGFFVTDDEKFSGRSLFWYVEPLEYRLMTLAMKDSDNVITVAGRRIARNTSLGDEYVKSLLGTTKLESDERSEYIELFEKMFSKAAHSWKRIYREQLTQTFYDKPIVAVLHHKDLSIYILDDGDYYNVHILDPKYQRNELNTLNRQESKDRVQESYFTTQMLISYLAEHILWDYFHCLNDKIYSFSVEVDSENN